MDLDTYRRAAEEFLVEYEREYYRHYAGLKADYEIEPIYARHADLFTSEAVMRLRGELEAAPAGSEHRRRLALLLDFAVEGYIGEATKAIDSELARREAKLVLELDGQRIGFRDAPVIQANEPDSERRATIERARLELLERELNGSYREL